MKLSLGIYPNRDPAGIVETAKLAETIGFATLWLLDSHLLFHEVYTLLGALAVATGKIRLGTAVTNPLTRHPTVTASALATLDALSRGRAILGIGVGDSALRAMNLQVARMDRLREAVRACRMLLRGDEVSFAPGGNACLANGAPRVPIYIAASGPKMLRLAGQLADGVILMNGVASDLIAAAIEVVEQGERDSGRRPGSVKIVVWAACHPDPAAVKFNVARAVLRNIPGHVPQLARETAAAIGRAYDYRHHGDVEARFAAMVPDELVPYYAFAGPPASMARQIEALRASRVDEVALAVPLTPNMASRDEVIAQIAPALMVAAAA